MKVGMGYDIHPLVEGRSLFLGGEKIPHPRGLLGHSDGDVLLHALCDALLGAMGDDDLGTLFPSTDPRYEGIASEVLVREVCSRMKEKGYSIHNLDAVIVAGEPKLAPHIPQMKKNIAHLLGIPREVTGLKAKNPEGLGALGSGEGIAAYVLVLLEEKGENG